LSEHKKLLEKLGDTIKLVNYLAESRYYIWSIKGEEKKEFDIMRFYSDLEDPQMFEDTFEEYIEYRPKWCIIFYLIKTLARIRRDISCELLHHAVNYVIRERIKRAQISGRDVRVVYYGSTRKDLTLIPTLTALWSIVDVINLALEVPSALKVEEQTRKYAKEKEELKKRLEEIIQGRGLRRMMTCIRELHYQLKKAQDISKNESRRFQRIIGALLVTIGIICGILIYAAPSWITLLGFFFGAYIPAMALFLDWLRERSLGVAREIYPKELEDKVKYILEYAEFALENLKNEENRKRFELHG